MDLMLLASLLALGTGPLLYYTLGRSSGAHRVLDRVAVLFIAGLVLLHILPHAVEESGALMLIPAALGALLVGLLARSPLSHGNGIKLGLLGLMIHALLDGLAVSSGAHAHEHVNVLGLAVVLHRLPESLGVWWLGHHVLGPAKTAGVLVAIAIFTLLGAGAGELVHDHVHDAAWLLPALRAFVGGTLLCVAALHAVRDHHAHAH